jgi:hypothetical protein
LFLTCAKGVIDDAQFVLSLTTDYREGKFDSRPRPVCQSANCHWAATDDDDYEMECKCGAPNCRKVITGQDWRRKDLQKKYAGYTSWYLLEKIKSE